MKQIVEDEYQKFLRSKRHKDERFGFKPIWMPGFLKDFQHYLTEWDIIKGRAATYAECGTGKSLIELVFGQNIVEKFNKPVLLLTPLAVSYQMVREGEKFGIEVKRTSNGRVFKGINVTNYERLHYYKPSDFQAIICDESSCIKDYSSKNRRMITEFGREIPYRLLATATPAPNDWMELGTSSEALGVMGRGQMLGTFFSHSEESTQQWELKGHARKQFWRWVCTWARALRKPSDLGFDDTGYILPELTVRQHVVDAGIPQYGLGFEGARTLTDQRSERKGSLRQRCEKVAELVPKNDYCVIWVHLNPEGDLLERMIADSVQVAGKDSDESKERKLASFSKGEFKTLITKQKIGGWGLNWQHCNRIILFPSHSWESYYQCIRRCWRFGQERPVTVDVVSSKGEQEVIRNMRRKDQQASAMFQEMVDAMREVLDNKEEVKAAKDVILPSWLIDFVT